jgi:S1-C subfamily serine protease
MGPMSNGDPTTAPAPTAGSTTPPVAGATGPAAPYPTAPPMAFPLAPPTAPVPPVQGPATPPAYTGPLPGGAGWTPPGSPPGTPPTAPTPTPTPGQGPRTGRTVAIAVLLVLALLAGVAGGFGLSRLADPADDTASRREVPEQPKGSPFGGRSELPAPGPGGEDEPAPRPSEELDVDAVAAKVTPGVVNLDVLTAQGGQGAGTGVVLSPDGLVLTNNHVIRGATRIVATEADSGQRYEAEVVGTARSKDLAVIQLKDAEDLDPVEIGDSSSVEVGDPVVALGNAGGTGGAPSVVTGRVIALGRSITASDESGARAQRLNNLIQIDADIIPGHSGGPLADADGKVIGINAAAASTNQISTDDEGYAIPIDDAMKIVEQIEAGEEDDVVRIGPRGVLGVSVTSVSDDPFGQGGSPVAGDGGAEGSGAEKAGVTVGSTITAVDGTRISSAEALTAALRNAEPGDEVELTWTDPQGRTRTATVTLTEGPPD